MLGELRALLNNEDTGLDQLLNVRLGEHGSRQLLVVRKWADFFLRYKKNGHEDFAYHLSTLNAMIAKAARKERNFGLAKQFLAKVLVCDSAGVSAVDLDRHVQGMDFGAGALCPTPEHASCLRQYAKIAFTAGDTAAAGGLLTGLVGSFSSLFLLSAAPPPAELSEVSSRALRNLACWVRADEALLQQVAGDSFQSILELERDSAGAVEFLPGAAADDAGMVVGRLLRLAVIQSPHLAKLWKSLADWALETGERVLQSCEKDGMALQGRREKSCRDGRVFVGFWMPN